MRVRRVVWSRLCENCRQQQQQQYELHVGDCESSNQTAWLYTAVATIRVTNISPAPTQILTTCDWLHFGLSITLYQGLPTDVTLHISPLIYVYFTAVNVYYCKTRFSAGHKSIWRSTGSAPLILKLGTCWRWVVSVTPRPLYPQAKSPSGTEQGLGGPQSRSGSFREKHLLSLQRIEPRFLTCRSGNLVTISTTSVTVPTVLT
jgi:hypothetical protein